MSEVSYELENFELEMELATGWTTVRANENEVAAFVLADKKAVQTMLTGSEISATQDGHVWRCRLTPKSWLVKQ